MRTILKTGRPFEETNTNSVMKYTVCNLCRQDDTELVNQGPDLLLNRGDTTFQLVRCRNCGLIYQNPQLTLGEVLQHYPDSYIAYRPDIDSERSIFSRLDQHIGMARRCRRTMHHHQHPARLLDVGCGTGRFLEAMRSRGWQVVGVEPNPYAAQYARSSFNLEVRTSTLEEAAFEDAAFDAISLWGVFEHVIDPKATLAEIARILKPGGLLVMSLPNPASLEARLFGPHWVGWDRPRHLHVFAPDVIERYLVEAELELDGIESFSGRLHITLLNIEFWCKAQGVPECKWRPLLKLLYNWPLRVLSWPIYRFGEAVNKTTQMTVFATRRT